MAGQIQSQGVQDAFQAALGANQQEYNDVLSGRQSYLSGGPSVASAQNALDVSRGLDIAGLENQRNISNTGQANQYNLASAGMANNFNLNPYQNPNALAQTHYQDLFQNAGFNDSLIGGALGAGSLGLGSGIGGSSGLGGGLKGLGAGLLRGF